MKHFVIATAGHVDHGKSSLVKALTGTDPDRLPEEKARQITIDLGFAELRLGDNIHAAIVDVPGHEDFVRNMIAGLGSIDLALLVVAADDGWMPQTEEHLQILEYLGVRRAIVALTKCDIGNPAEVESQIRAQLGTTRFANAPIISTSICSSSSPNRFHRKPLTVEPETEPNGLGDLIRTIAAELAGTKPQRDIGKPRLFVDRAFTLHGIGTVITGTLTGGTLYTGDTVVVQPRGLSARVRSLQSHGKSVDLAIPGTRIAINLPDLAIGENIARGDVITTPGLEPSSTLDVALTKSPRLAKQSGAGRPLKPGTTVFVHHGATRVAAKVILLDNGPLGIGSTTIGELRLQAPILAFLGDHVVLRDASGQHTIAGAVVLDPNANPLRFRSAEQRRLLAARVAQFDNVYLCAQTEIARHELMMREGILTKSHFPRDEIEAALQRMARANAIFSDRIIVAAIAKWKELRENARKLIDAAHREKPERTGLPLSDLRAFVNQPEAVVDALIVDLCADEFVQVGSTIARRDHRPALSQETLPGADAIRKSLAAKPFDPPSRRELEPDAES